MSKYAIGLLLVLAVALVGLPEAAAHPEFLDAFNARYGTVGTRLDTCYTCHIPNGPKGVWNPYGMAVHEELEALMDDHTRIGEAIAAVEPLDSDSDTYTNIVEINALTFPGDAYDNPATIANVTFEVVDGSGFAIQGASVKLEGSGKAVKTDSTGKVVFTGVSLGDHNYTVSARGYIRTTYVISVIAGDNPVTVVLAQR